MSVEKRLEILREKKRIREGLPHLYGFDLYPYQKEFIEQTFEWSFLCCANQLGKTTAMLIKLVTLATDQKLWKKCWVDRPKTLIYFLPNQKLHDENARTKWMDVLPRGDFKYDDYYGWEWEKRGKNHLAINFKNGTKIILLSYGQKVDNLQNISAHVICFDEEPSHHIVPEVQIRTAAIKVAKTNSSKAFGGFKIFGFTATKSQKYFKDILEGVGDQEKMPVSNGNVWKKQVSLYDCQHHISGEPSQWTDEKIAAVIKSLPTEADIKRRVFGKFQISAGLVYQSFDSTKNVLETRLKIPDTYRYYAGIDYGGGGTSHPSAIVLVAVNSRYNQAYVTDVWIGQGEITTADDVVEKYIAMTRNKTITQAFYDWGAKDLHTFAIRKGIQLFKANKDHKIGESVLNSLFKSETLKIINDTVFSTQLINEFLSFNTAVAKRVADDHGIDALRYAVSSIPWDFSNLDGRKELKEVLETTHNPNSVMTRTGRRTMFSREGDHTDGYDEQREWADLFDF